MKKLLAKLFKRKKIPEFLPGDIVRVKTDNEAVKIAIVYEVAVNLEYARVIGFEQILPFCGWASNSFCHVEPRAEMIRFSDLTKLSETG